MEVDYAGITTCAVTHHLVEDVANSNPNVFKERNGAVKLHSVLYYLGFDIRNSLIDKNVTYHPDALIRCSNDNKKCYRANVYKGWLRDEVSSVVDGKIKYNKGKKHILHDTYNQYEVLQSVDLAKHIGAEDYLDIDDFGGKTKLSDIVEV